MRTFVRHSTAAVAAASQIALLCATGAGAAEFSNVWFFGDSLTDAGVNSGARFTTNPGTVWAQNLGALYGFQITPFNRGGTDYATGGARLLAQEGYPDPNSAALIPPVATQLGLYLAANPAANGQALYGIWGGANDILYGVNAAGAGRLTSAQVQGLVAQSAGSVIEQANRLRNAGARYIMIANLPDLGRTPLGTATPAAPFSALSGLFNSTLAAGIGALPYDIVSVNVAGLFTEISANPSAYGFVNTTTPACTTSSSLACTPATLRDPNAPNTWVFADAIHPTTGAHRVVSDYAYSILEAPQKIGVLGEAPLQVEEQIFRSIDGRLRSAPQRAAGTTDAYAVYDYSPGELDRTARNPGTDLNGNSILVGVDHRISNSATVGVALGVSQNKADFDSNGGGFKLQEATLTAYGTMNFGPAWVGGGVTVGDLQFKDIRRNIALGQGVRTETGSTKGTHIAATLVGGYTMQAGSWYHGPVARITWQQAKVKQYFENSLNSTAMFFGQQERDSLLTSLGYQLSGSLGAVRPFARLSWEKEHEDGNRELRAGLATMPGSFSMPVYRPDDSYFKVDLGIAADFGRNMTGFLGYSTSFDKGDGRNQAVTAGIRIGL